MGHVMKKIFMLTAFTLAGFASAQESSVLNAAENYNKAQEYAVQADVAYPISFYDRILWKAAVNHAFFASVAETENRDYAAYLAQLYTKTQWWINAYSMWQKLPDLSDIEKEWAALTAAKLGYLALQRGDKQLARQYVQQGLDWKENASLLALKKKL